MDGDLTLGDATVEDGSAEDADAKDAFVSVEVADAAVFEDATAEAATTEVVLAVGESVGAEDCAVAMRSFASYLDAETKDDTFHTQMNVFKSTWT
jgi:hypothetical protein